MSSLADRSTPSYTDSRIMYGMGWHKLNQEFYVYGSMHAFSYFVSSRPLDSSSAEIRLLRPVHKPQPAVSNILQPPSVPSDIIIIPDLSLEFELEVKSLHEKPVYTTLSYCWGSKRKTESIIINGAEFLVTKNLIAALRHLRCEDIEGGAIWIDAICINQADAAERTQQCAVMGRIYSSAARCIAWLGETRGNSEYLAECLYAFGRIARQRFDVPERLKYPLFEYFDFDSATDVYLLISQAMAAASRFGAPYSDPRLFIRAFVEFISGLEYWFRVWITQEFVLSPKVTFQIGNRPIELEELSAILVLSILLASELVLTEYVADHAVLDLLPRQPGQKWIMELLAFRERHEKGILLGRVGVFELLCKTYCHPVYPETKRGFSQASDRLDQIWALYSLFERDFERLGLEMDYQKYEWQDVYSDVAQTLIQSGCLDVLSLRGSTVPLECPEIPSWAPIWHEPIILPSAWFNSGVENGSLILGFSLFAAGTLNKLKVSFPETNVAEPRRMYIEGVLVDSILDTKSTYLRSCWTSHKDREFLNGKLFRDIECLRNRSKRLGHGIYSPSQLLEAAWRMPVWDHETPEGSDEEGIRRATHASQARHEACVPLFKAVEAHSSEQRVIESLHHYNLQAIWAWPHIYFHRLLSAYYLSVFKKEPFRWKKLGGVFSWLRSVAACSRNPLLEIQGFMTPGIAQYLIMMEVGRPIRPFITKTGYIGIGPPSMRPDDVLCVLFGSHMPYVLRPLPQHLGAYTFVGDAYVHGIMDGEILRSGHQGVEIEVVEEMEPVNQVASAEGTYIHIPSYLSTTQLHYEEGRQYC
ncbi:heterokaryon incompatibility protein-domain-containing protein [Xylariaceae sp. AK1471]|nr:heterokaryon incompatibility protein-domain-containing protein [Xylariaceae sp. AK1471]